MVFPAKMENTHYDAKTSHLPSGGCLQRGNNTLHILKWKVESMVRCTSWFNPSERWRIIYFINVTDVKQVQIKNNSVVIAVLKNILWKRKELKEMQKPDEWTLTKTQKISNNNQ